MHFPVVFGWVGGVFFLLVSCIWHHLYRFKLGKPGEPARKTPGPPPPLHLARTPSPSLAGSCRGGGDEPSARAVG